MQAASAFEPTQVSDDHKQGDSGTALRIRLQTSYIVLILLFVLNPNTAAIHGIAVTDTTP